MPDPRRIMIVEDDMILAMQYRMMLEQSGYTALDAIMTGEEAVERAAELQPDLILMDIVLAGKMTGIEAYRAINQRHQIPVVYLSGLSDDSQIRDAQELGAYGYLLKPVTGRDLHAAIEMALYKHEIENRLRQSEKRYRMLFEKMNNGFGLGEIVYGEDGSPFDIRVLAMNPAFSRMVRVHSRRLVGRTFKESLPDFDSKVLLDYCSSVAQTGVPAQFEFYLPQGQRYLDISAFSPEPGQFAVIIEDVTERRRAERQLQESEVRFRQLAESVREVFWLQSGADGKMLYISPAYERIFGRSASELLSDHTGLFSFAHPDDAQLLAQAGQLLEETGRPLNEEYRIVRPDGDQRWIWARSYPVCDDSGEVVCYSGVAEDITERKQAEQQIRESYARIEQSLRRMTTLRSIDTVITTQSDLPVMAASILAHMVELEEIDGVILFAPAGRGPAMPVSVQPALKAAAMSGVALHMVGSQAQAWEQEAVSRVYESNRSEFISAKDEALPPGAMQFFAHTGFTSCATLPLKARDQVKGVLQFFSRQDARGNTDWRGFLEALAVQMAIAMDNVDMFENLKRSNRELARAYEETIKGWAQALEMRDKETRGHSDRVTQLAEKLARTLRMPEDEIQHFRRGVLLHDIGKMGIPDKILNKPEELSAEEWVIMRQHPGYAYEMLSSIEFLRPALDVVYYHHEKWDGSGYPSGLSGEDIPLPARIFSVVDVYDALTTRRPYRPPWPKSDALRYIEQQSGKQFDPTIVEVFLDLLS